jgi:hypothetical protein
MSRKTWASAALAAAMLWVAAAAAQTRVHGADSLFSASTLKLAWAVLKGRVESETRVVIRIVNIAGAYRFIRVDGVDPFTKARAAFADPIPLGKTADISVARTRFADHPSAELHLFHDEAAVRANKAALIVFYLGVPDTTPEFMSPAAVEAYFDRMLGAGR